MQPTAESIQGGVPRVPHPGHRHGPGDGHVVPLPAAEEHEVAAVARRAHCRQVQGSLPHSTLL